MIYVYVQFGAVSEIRGNKDEVVIIDLDTLHNGQCPKCKGELNDELCQACDIDWSNWTFDMVEKDHERKDHVP